MNAEYYKEKLLARLKELNVRLHEIEEELDMPHEQDFEEMAVQIEDDEVLEGLGNKCLTEARQIQAALTRIRQNSFGICKVCGGQISLERLEILPHTLLCRKCAI